MKVTWLSQSGERLQLKWPGRVDTGLPMALIQQKQESIKVPENDEDQMKNSPSQLTCGPYL